MSDRPKCIDISHYQGYPDFQTVADAGVVAMIHKATQGVGYVDPYRAKNCSNAIKAGIKIATYHWLSHERDPKLQMDHYIKTIDPVPGERMVIDYEENGCTLDELTQAVQALLDDQRKFQITVYSGHLLKEQLGSRRNSFLAENTDLWIAQYTNRNSPTWPSRTYPEWKLWQYLDTGHVDGVPGKSVDLNRYNGSDDELLKWISPK